MRAELAALAAEPHPFAFWQRAEQLPDRFEQEQRGSGPAGRPVTEPSRPSTGGLPSLSGDLGGAPARPAEMSGSLEPDEPRHGRPESASLSGSLLPPAENPRPAPNPAPDSGPQPQVRDGVLRGPLVDGPPSGPVPQLSDAPPPVEAPRPPHPPMAQPPVPDPPMAEPPMAEPSRSEPPMAQPPRPEPPMSEPPESPFAEQASLPPRPDTAQRPDGPPPSPPAGMPPAGPRPQGPPPGPPSGPMPQQGPPPGHQAPAGPPPPQHPSPPAGTPSPPNGGPQRPPGPPGPQGPPPTAPPPRPGPPPAPQQAEQPVAQQPPRRPEPPRPPEQHQAEPPQQQDQQRPKSRTLRTPKINERADGGFGPMGSAGAWSNGTGRAGYGRNTSWSADDFKEERREGGDDLRAGSGYKPGETGSGAVPQFLIEADELWDDDDGGRLVAPPVLGESPASFRDF